MAEGTKYINEGNPVYISYSWANECHPNLEDDVDALCNLMKKNGILYKRDKDSNPTHSLLDYTDDIKKAEEEIGKGNAIIMIISEKYLCAPHCLHELHCMLQKGPNDFSKRVFPIVLFGSERYDEVFLESIDKVAGTIAELESRQKRGVTISSIEQQLINNKGYKKDKGELLRYIKDKVIHPHNILKNNDYAKLMDKLVDHIGKVDKGKPKAQSCMSILTGLGFFVVLILMLRACFSAKEKTNNGNTSKTALEWKHEGKRYFDSKDYETAFLPFKNAAKMGDAEAQFYIGFYYYCDSLGVKKDYNKAIDWFLSSANNGDDKGQNFLGWCYYQGLGTTKDYQKAKSWFEKSAKQGNSNAQYNLGVLYENGLVGAQPNLNEAINWYLKAAKQENPKAYEALKRLNIQWK